jgi:hypothetical protein
MLNSVKAQPKKSSVEKAMSNQVAIIFIFQNIVGFFSSFYYLFWLENHEVKVTQL